jgi:hypothetical protein
MYSLMIPALGSKLVGVINEDLVLFYLLVAFTSARASVYISAQLWITFTFMYHLSTVHTPLPSVLLDCQVISMHFF